MHDRRRALLGDPRGEPIADLLDQGQLAGVLLFPLTAPAAQLAGDVVGPAGQLAKTDGIGIDGVDRDQGVDHPLGDRVAVGRVGEQLGVRKRTAAPDPRPSA